MEIKDRILEKAHEMFIRFGIRSVSMDDIAAQLGMSKKTLYQYYADKEELVDAVVSSMLAENKQRCSQESEVAENAVHEVMMAFDMAAEMFSNMNPSVLFDLEKYHPVVFKKFKQFKFEFLKDIVANNLKRGIEEELYRPEINIDVLTRFRLATFLLPFNSDVFPGNKNQLVNINEQIMEHFLYGCATAKGHKMIAKYKQQRQLINQ